MTKKRFLRTFLLVILVASLVAPLNSSADFHPVCQPIIATYATVGLDASENGTIFTFSGKVICPGAEEISGFLLFDTVPPSPYEIPFDEPGLADTTGSCSGDCGNQFEFSGTYSDPSGLEIPTGIYEVAMTFDIKRGSNIYTGVKRVGRWKWTGHTQVTVGSNEFESDPIPMCTPAGFVGGSDAPIEQILPGCAGTLVTTVFFTYQPGNVVVERGHNVAVANVDFDTHTFTHCPLPLPGVFGTECIGDPSFDSGNVGPFGGTGNADLTNVPVGTYSFYCTVHGYDVMRGTLQVREDDPI